MNNLQRNLKIEKVAFLGGAGWKETELPYKGSYDTAKLLAENGFVIVNGGGPGVMKASTQGAKAAGKEAIAITYMPSTIKRHYEGVDKNNEFSTEITTLDYFDRTKVMLQTTDAHIVFNGSIGTLSELGMTWVSSWIHYPNSKPIVLFGDFWREYIDFIKKYMLLDHGEENMMKICHSPEEVLEYLMGFNKL
ncbi:hypothetical protein A2V49_01720 [candidate division WWE3 bacterium RBG_19FT_COMBO_34_6]|uniref:DNA-binding protein n=1 Tax=candidate division WWE3 bacterium RBG_19FT_COMBO_34_6 TaxID=1802612 RepID=A0A1F4UKF4_UNCKA|nr:MAG: hypothetical protein A2V49_01720 [candidate division WWE3 bacterium RBG_19FT_COMBO_34_6]